MNNFFDIRDTLVSEKDAGYTISSNFGFKTTGRKGKKMLEFLVRNAGSLNKKIHP